MQRTAFELPSPKEEIFHSTPAESTGAMWEDFIRVMGTSDRPQCAPREIDLKVDGNELQMHIHHPGASKPKMWVSRKALQEAFDRWKQSGESTGEITISSRRARSESQLAFVLDDPNEVLVKAIDWILVGRKELGAAFEELGVRVPW